MNSLSSMASIYFTWHIERNFWWNKCRFIIRSPKEAKTLLDQLSQTTNVRTVLQHVNHTFTCLVPSEPNRVSGCVGPTTFQMSTVNCSLWNMIQPIQPVPPDCRKQKSMRDLPLLLSPKPTPYRRSGHHSMSQLHSHWCQECDLQQQLQLQP